MADILWAAVEYTYYVVQAGVVFNGRMRVEGVDFEISVAKPMTQPAGSSQICENSRAFYPAVWGWLECLFVGRVAVGHTKF